MLAGDGAAGASGLPAPGTGYAAQVHHGADSPPDAFGGHFDHLVPDMGVAHVGDREIEAAAERVGQTIEALIGRKRSHRANDDGSLNLIGVEPLAKPFEQA